MLFNESKDSKKFAAISGSILICASSKHQNMNPNNSNTFFKVVSFVFNKGIWTESTKKIQKYVRQQDLERAHERRKKRKEDIPTQLDIILDWVKGC